jgi:hypothetical protein
LNADILFFFAKTASGALAIAMIAMAQKIVAIELRQILNGFFIII